MAKLYRKGGPSGGEVATVEAQSGLLRVEAGGAAILLPYERLKGRIGGFEDAFVIFEAGGQPGLELWVDSKFVRTEMAVFRNGFGSEFGAHFDTLVGTHKRRTGTRKGIRALLLVGFLVLAGWFLTGGLVTIALAVIPRSVEVKIGEVAAEQFAAQAPTCTEPTLTSAVTKILDDLVSQMDQVDYEYRVRVLRSDDINAFALPGGELFFFSGLLETTDSPDEVAAVMGHEIQHVVRRHGLRGMLQALGTRALVMLVLGGASDGAQVIGGTASQMGQLKFGRDQEREADERGVALMSRAGYDPEGAIVFFGKLAEMTGDSGGALDQVTAMTSTHPASSERQERLRALAADLPPPEPRPESSEWVKMRGLCAGNEG